MSQTIERNTTAVISSAELSLMASLIGLGKAVRAMMGLKLAEIDLHPGQDELLLALDVAKPLPVSHVAEALGVRPSTVSKMLDRLVEKGFLERALDKEDARRTGVQITPKGVDKVAQILEMRAALDLEVGRALEASPLVTTAADVEALSQIVSTRLHRLR